MTFTWEPDVTGLGTVWSELDETEQDRALMLATSSLQALTYNRVGTPPITIRPCPVPRECGCAIWEPYLMVPWRGPEQFLNPCGCRIARWCAPLSEIDLEGPVGYVQSIRIDGELQRLDTGNWRLDDGHLLVWQGEGTSPVPVTQNLDAPDTEVGTWSVTYSKSYPVLADARLAVALLAVEFAKSFTKIKGKCALPRGVTNVTRNGVSFSVEAGLFPNGLTGIDIVDQFILKWAPAGSPSQPAAVFDIRKTKARVSSRLPLGVPHYNGGNNGVDGLYISVDEPTDPTWRWWLKYDPDTDDPTDLRRHT